MHSAEVQYNGGLVKLVIDGGDEVFSRETLSFNEALVTGVIVNASGHEITGKFLDYIAEYPRPVSGDNTKTELYIALDYPWALDRVNWNVANANISLSVPSGLISNGSYSSPQISITGVVNDSFWADPYDQHSRISASHQIVFIDHENGVASGVVYANKAALPNPNNTRYPGAVVAFDTIDRAYTALRGTDNFNLTRQRTFAMLFKGGVDITSSRAGSLTHNRTHCVYSTARTLPNVWDMYDCEPGTITRITASGMSSLIGSRGYGFAINGGFDISQSTYLANYSAGAPQPTTLTGVRQNYIFIGPTRNRNCTNRVVWLGVPGTSTNDWGAEKMIFVQPMADIYAQSGTTNPSAISIDGGVMPNGDPIYRDVEVVRLFAGQHAGPGNGLLHVAYVKGPCERLRTHGVCSQNGDSIGVPKNDGIVNSSHNFWLVGNSGPTDTNSVNLEVNNGDISIYGERVDRSDYGPNTAGRNSVRNTIRNFVSCGSVGFKMQSSYEDLAENILFICNGGGTYGLFQNARNPGSSLGLPQEMGEGFRSRIRKMVGYMISSGRGISINTPVTDDPTADASIGFHDYTVSNSIISGSGSNTLIRILSDNYLNAKENGRVSLVVSNSAFYDYNGPNGRFIDNNNTYNSLAAIKAVTDDLVADSCIYQDPQFIDQSRDLTRYAILQGFSTQQEMWEAIRNGAWSGTLPESLREDVIANWLIEGFTPQNSGVYNSGQYVDFWGGVSSFQEPNTSLSLRTESDGVLPSPVQVSGQINDTVVYNYRLYANNQAFDGANLDISTSGSITSTTFRDPSNNLINIADYVIPRNSYVNIRSQFPSNISVENQLSSITFDGSSVDAGTQVINFNLNIASGPTPRLLLTDEFGGDLDNPTIINTNVSNEPYQLKVRLYSLDNSFDGSRISFDATLIEDDEVFDSSNNPITDLSEYTIPENSFIYIVLFLDRSVAGQTQPYLEISDTLDESDPQELFITLNSQATAPILQVREGSTNLTSGQTNTSGERFIATTLNKNLTLRNNGNAALNFGFDGFSVEGNLQILNDTLPLSLGIGSETDITLGINTAISGSTSGVLTISSNDANSPFTQIFTANILSPELVAVNLPEEVYSFGTVNYNTSQQFTLQLANIGTTGVIINSTPQNDINLLSPSIQTILPNSSGTISVGLKTNQTGQKSGNLNVTTNYPTVTGYSIGFSGSVIRGNNYVTRFTSAINSDQVVREKVSDAKMKSNSPPDNIPTNTEPTDSTHSKVEDLLLNNNNLKMNNDYVESNTENVNYEVILGSGDNSINSTSIFYKGPTDTQDTER